MDKILEHLGHVECLEVAWHGSPPIKVWVDCTQCGCVVHELFDENSEDQTVDAEEIKKKLWWILYDRDAHRMSQVAKAGREEMLYEIMKVVT